MPDQLPEREPFEQKRDPTTAELFGGTLLDIDILTGVACTVAAGAPDDARNVYPRSATDVLRTVVGQSVDFDPSDDYGIRAKLGIRERAEISLGSLPSLLLGGMIMKKDADGNLCLEILGPHQDVPNSTRPGTTTSFRHIRRYTVRGGRIVELNGTMPTLSALKECGENPISAMIRSQQGMEEAYALGIEGTPVSDELAEALTQRLILYRNKLQELINNPDRLRTVLQLIEDSDGSNDEAIFAALQGEQAHEGLGTQFNYANNAFRSATTEATRIYLRAVDDTEAINAYEGWLAAGMPESGETEEDTPLARFLDMQDTLRETVLAGSMSIWHPDMETVTPEAYCLQPRGAQPLFITIETRGDDAILALRCSDNLGSTVIREEVRKGNDVRDPAAIAPITNIILTANATNNLGFNLENYGIDPREFITAVTQRLSEIAERIAKLNGEGTPISIE